jgi:heptosyltransferase-1
VLGFARSHLREKTAAPFYRETWRPPGGVHVVWKNLSVLPRLGIDKPSTPEFALAEGDRSILEEAGRRHPAIAGGYVLLNPGAAWPNKRWPAARFGELAFKIAERDGLPSLVVWGPDESGVAEEVEARAGGAAFLAPPTRLPGLLALARGARLVISGDTGPLHVAAAAGAPVVALFGPTDPRRNGPWSSADIVVSRFDTCDCHYKRRCRRKAACIADITVDEVLAAAGRRLASG